MADTAHILVVEDEEDIQRLVSFNLMKAGFHVICADDGVMGLAKLEQDKIDLIVLDDATHCATPDIQRQVGIIEISVHLDC